jgi:hypothetical protein
MARTVDNNGVGALYATFRVHSTSGQEDLVPADISRAVALSGSNEVNKGVDGAVLLGRLVQVRDSLATVQIRGVMRFDVNTTKAAPSVGDHVVVDGDGKVYQAPELVGYDPAGGTAGRGTVIAVDNANDRCDVLL